MAYDLAAIALYDVVLYVDDSSSMAFEENGGRIDDLKFILQRVAELYTIFDEVGIAVRFMNSHVGVSNLRIQSEVQSLFQEVRFSGPTPLGTSLYAKILQPLFHGAHNNELSKPLLIIILTNSPPNGEDPATFRRVLVQIQNAIRQTAYGPGALVTEIVQVGKNKDAQRFWVQMANDPLLKGILHARMDYELEADECLKNGSSLTSDMWLVEALCQAIDPKHAVETAEVGLGDMGGGGEEIGEFDLNNPRFLGHQVLVTNVAHTVDSATLEEHFLAAGPIAWTAIDRSHESAIVIFQSSGSADKANVELDGSFLHGRGLKVSMVSVPRGNWILVGTVKGWGFRLEIPIIDVLMRSTMTYRPLVTTAASVTSEPVGTEIPGERALIDAISALSVLKSPDPGPEQRSHSVLARALRTLAGAKPMAGAATTPLAVPSAAGKATARTAQTVAMLIEITEMSVGRGMAVMTWGRGGSMTMILP
ncbi:hypothetical protein HK097_005013 [Rhizophlyctis rosea]|uniref:VWFA domain-containing protein n=1 Tax=Rhizophlyctis rosea TaxID=64517 RepID=A0AAD5WYN9_9FUNG|nr:hypothetical protein HK097_005013 [Rhizophlyctis rosea]